MFIESNSDLESRKLEELVNSDEEIRRQHELFIAEMAFKQQLIDARKEQAITQTQLSKLSGLSQQAISRLERGDGGNIQTVLRYLYSLGFSLKVQKSV